jgi:hypothetical protein
MYTARNVELTLGAKSLLFLQLGIKTKGFIVGIPMEKESVRPQKTVLPNVA